MNVRQVARGSRVLSCTVIGNSNAPTSRASEVPVTDNDNVQRPFVSTALTAKTPVRSGSVRNGSNAKVGAPVAGSSTAKRPGGAVESHPCGSPGSTGSSGAGPTWIVASS